MIVPSVCAEGQRISLFLLEDAEIVRRKIVCHAIHIHSNIRILFVPIVLIQGLFYKIINVLVPMDNQ